MSILSILQISPTYYSRKSVLGGGEKYVVYMSRAIRAAARARGQIAQILIVAFGEAGIRTPPDDDIPCEIVSGRPWDVNSVDLADLHEKLQHFETIIVHQCLSAFGLFVAAHARMAGKFVVGVDEGGGEHRLVGHTRELGRIFDLFLAYSQFVSNSFQDLEGRVALILGPVDTDYYKQDPGQARDETLVLAIGRILPHKGFEQIIRVLPSSLRLVIVGSSYDTEYRQYLEHLSRGKHVEILDGVDDREALRLMQTAHVFVHSSTHVDYRGKYYFKPELLGLAPLEALSAGTPTIVSTAGALPELAILAGCRQFTSENELRELLNRHAEFSTLFPSPPEIHRSVEAVYGLDTFGGKFLDEVQSLS